MKILVVDDSLLDRKLLIRTLVKGEVQQEILQAEDGEQALEVLANQYIDNPSLTIVPQSEWMIQTIPTATRSYYPQEEDLG